MGVYIPVWGFFVMYLDEEKLSSKQILIGGIIQVLFFVLVIILPIVLILPSGK